MTKLELQTEMEIALHRLSVSQEIIEFKNQRIRALEEALHDLLDGGGGSLTRIRARQILKGEN